MYFLRHLIFFLILIHFDWSTAKTVKLTSNSVGDFISQKNHVKRQEFFDETTPADDTTTTTFDETTPADDTTTTTTTNTFDITSSTSAINNTRTKIDINSDQAKQIANQIVEELDKFLGQGAGEVRSVEYITIFHRHYDLKMVICHKRLVDDHQTTTVPSITNEPTSETSTLTEIPTSTADPVMIIMTTSTPVTKPCISKTTKKNRDICKDLNCDDLDLDFDFDFSIKNRVRKAAPMQTFCENCQISAKYTNFTDRYEILEHRCIPITLSTENTTTDLPNYPGYPF